MLTLQAHFSDIFSDIFLIQFLRIIDNLRLKHSRWWGRVTHVSHILLLIRFLLHHIAARSCKCSSNPPPHKEACNWGEREKNCQKECLNMNHRWSGFTFKYAAGPHLKLGPLGLSQAGEKQQPGFEMRNRNLVKVRWRSTSPFNRFAWTEMGKVWWKIFHALECNWNALVV